MERKSVGAAPKASPKAMVKPQSPSTLPGVAVAIRIRFTAAA